MGLSNLRIRRLQNFFLLLSQFLQNYSHTKYEKKAPVNPGPLAQLFITSHYLHCLSILHSYSNIHRKTSKNKCYFSICLGFYDMTTNPPFTSKLFNHSTNIKGISMCLAVETEISSPKCSVFNC